MIKLLNNTEVEIADIIEKAKDDNYYYGELNDLVLSSSVLKDLLDSPKTYRFRKQQGQVTSQALRDGWLFHTMILEPEKIDDLLFVDVQSKNTKKYREAVAENGPNTFTIKEKNDAERLSDAFLRNEKCLQLMNKTTSEVPIVGIVDGYPFRGKADILGENHIVDLKTTSDIKGFKYSFYKYHYDMQAYIYCNLFNISYKNFTFIVCDKGSLDIGICHISEDAYNSGREKVLTALDRYHTFVEQGVDIDSYYIEFTL